MDISPEDLEWEQAEVFPPVSGDEPSAKTIRAMAIMLLAADSVMTDQLKVSEAFIHAYNVARSVDTDPAWAEGKHTGDCTKDPVTCSRCVIENYERIAKLHFYSGDSIPDFIDTLIESASTPFD